MKSRFEGSASLQLSPDLPRNGSLLEPAALHAANVILMENTTENRLLRNSQALDLVHSYRTQIMDQQAQALNALQNATLHEDGMEASQTNGKSNGQSDVSEVKDNKCKLSEANIFRVRATTTGT